MPILPPNPNIEKSIGSAFTIGNCVQNLPAKFGNRQDLSSYIDGSKSVNAVMEAIKELSETYEFEELKYQTPVPPVATLGLSIGNPIVPVGLILSTIQTNNLYPQFQGQNWVDITDVYTFWIWFAGGGVGGVNQAGRALKYRRVTTIDTYSYGITSNIQNSLGTAPPVYYTRFGNILQVGPVPDQTYAYFVRVKLRHPFPVGGTGVFTPAAFTTTINGSGIVTAVNVVSGGQGYLPSQTTIPLYFPTSPNGSVATANANTNSSGIVTSVTIGSGASGYATAPVPSTAAIASQQVFLPDSWQEIVETAACHRLALWEGAQEYVSMFEGWLESKGVNVSEARARKAQNVRDELHNERAFSLRVPAYTFAQGGS